MLSNLNLALLSAAALAPLAVAEDVLGVYIFHRHGDRTAKTWKPVNLTALGADEVHSSGQFYRRRYIGSSDSDSDPDSASALVSGLSRDNAVLSQLSVTSPVDTVLHNSALTFLQGLYPPTDRPSEVLANGTRVEGPLNGYQYIPVNAVADAASAKKSESQEWLQGGSGCNKAEDSSNAYFSSPEYMKTYDESKGFYQDLLPVIQTAFDKDEANFHNGYTIFDLINVATIHNSSIPSSDLLTKPTLSKLYDLASTHEWNLAYNSTETVRAIAGSVLAGQIVDALAAIVEPKDGDAAAPKLNIQFGAYGTFMAFFGLAQLPAASPDFYGICDYASSMAFELVTNATDPSPEDVSVRFLFANGTAGQTAELKPFPLFGQGEDTIKWADFKAGMGDFAIADTQHWCDVCGNTDGQCAGSDSDGGDVSSKSDDSGSGSGISTPIAGVIGALVTLVVILGIEALVFFVGGLRLVKKSTLRRPADASEGGVKA